MRARAVTAAASAAWPGAPASPGADARAAAKARATAAWKRRTSSSISRGRRFPDSSTAERSRRREASCASTSTSDFAKFPDRWSSHGTVNFPIQAACALASASASRTAGRSGSAAGSTRDAESLTWSRGGRARPGGIRRWNGFSSPRLTRRSRVGRTSSRRTLPSEKRPPRRMGRIREMNHRVRGSTRLWSTPTPTRTTGIMRRARTPPSSSPAPVPPNASSWMAARPVRAFPSGLQTDPRSSPVAHD